MILLDGASGGTNDLVKPIATVLPVSTFAGIPLLNAKISSNNKCILANIKLTAITRFHIRPQILGFIDMPTITIKNCNETPNYDALEAVAKWMRRNYTERAYHESRVIKVESGRDIYVKEIKLEDLDDESVCNCEFEVVKLANS